MGTGKEYYSTLRQMYRDADHRRFRTKHRSNRHAELLGFTPDGKSMVGFWEGQDEVTYFAADELNWTALTVYV